MRSSRTLRALPACAALFAASTVLAPPPVVSEAAAKPTSAGISVLSTSVWTPTGVMVAAGEVIEVQAVGRIRFGSSPIDELAPAGIPRAGGCSGIATDAQQWPAPALACWALIGKIGDAQPFEIGSARTYRATIAGELFLGVNDNYLRDNSGTWSAEVDVTAAPGAAGSNESSTLKKTAIALAVLVSLIGLLALGLLVARRRTAARRTAAAQPTETEPRELAAVVAGRVPGDILPEPRGHAATEAAVAPTPTPAIVVPMGDPTDVNIFEVEFPDFASLRVGYSYFPEGTEVRWLVRQGSTTAATGTFVTSGGGGANHYVTIVLGTELELRSEAADVDFTWEIGGVPFGYSVRRDPGP